LIREPSKISSKEFRVRWGSVSSAGSPSGIFASPFSEETASVTPHGDLLTRHFGNQGLSTFPAGYPKVTQVACPNNPTLDTVEEYVGASNSGLHYDAAADQYNYVWKTQKTYAGKCYKLDVMLIDGTHHEVKS